LRPAECELVLVVETMGGSTESTRSPELSEPLRE